MKLRWRELPVSEYRYASEGLVLHTLGSRYVLEFAHNPGDPSEYWEEIPTVSP